MLKVSFLNDLWSMVWLFFCYSKIQMIIKSYEYEISFHVYSYLILFKIVWWDTVNSSCYSLSCVGKRFLTAIQVRNECFGFKLVNHTALCHIAPPVVYAESPTYQKLRRSSHEVSFQFSICTDHQFPTKLILVVRRFQNF